MPLSGGINRPEMQENNEKPTEGPGIVEETRLVILSSGIVYSVQGLSNN